MEERRSREIDLQKISVALAGREAAEKGCEALALLALPVESSCHRVPPPRIANDC